MKYTQVTITGEYDFNVQGGAVGTIVLPMTPSISPGGSNMQLFIQIASFVVGSSFGGDITTDIDFQLGGVSLFGAITDPNNLLVGDVATSPTKYAIPNNSTLSLVIGVLPVTQGDCKIVLSGYIIYL